MATNLIIKLHETESLPRTKQNLKSSRNLNHMPTTVYQPMFLKASHIQLLTMKRKRNVQSCIYQQDETIEIIWKTLSVLLTSPIVVTKFKLCLSCAFTDQPVAFAAHALVARCDLHRILYDRLI
jgi:hypothetical protein